MKKILITGANSYIGMSFEKYMSQWPEDYQVDTVDMRGEDWKQTSFAGYDAGIDADAVEQLRGFGLGVPAAQLGKLALKLGCTHNYNVAVVSLYGVVDLLAELL